MRFKLAFAATIALTVAILAPYTAAAGEKSVGIDVAAARVAAEHQLRDLGINPSDAVFQGGPRNYAGADCPGADWNCTTASVVVQIGVATAPSVSNSFECNPETGGNGTTVCIAVQFTPAGAKANNHARCRIHGSGPTQSCTIDQTNLSGGSNDAQTDMLIDLNGGSSQSGTQTATVRQRTNTGDNYSNLSQTIRLTTQDVAVGTQTQLGIQRAVVCQGGPTPTPTPGDEGICPIDATDGNNFSHVDQSLSLRATAVGGSEIVQSQNPTGGTTGCRLVSPNTAADIDQATTGGKNHSELKQANDLDGRVRDILGSAVDQTQGSASGGLEGCVNQTAGPTGFSTSHASQHDTQNLKGPADANQIQFGPEFCCGTQVGPGTVNIDQHKSQSSTSSFQQGLVTGHFDTLDGQGRLDQFASNNVDSQRNSCSGTFCFEVVACNSSSEGGECFVVEDF